MRQMAQGKPETFKTHFLILFHIRLSCLHDIFTHALQGRVKTLPLCESSREDVTMSISQFLSPRNYFQVQCLLENALTKPHAITTLPINDLPALTRRC